MDNIDTLVKGSERTSARTDTTEGKVNGQAQGASLNVQATSSYLVLLSKQRGLLSEGLSRTLNSLAGTLNEYLKNPAALQNQTVDLSSSELAQYRRLSEQVISRDPDLQEKVAQNLSTSHRLVRSRDAAQELSKSMQNLPESLREGTQAGKALSRFICESLVDLTDPKSMGAGLERDLAVRSVFVPKTPLNTRSYQATSSVLSSSIAYIESNQPQVLSTLKVETQVPQEKAPESNAPTTPQAMTRYLRQALNEFPDDSTYLDIFKQNRDHKKEEPYQDKLSKETAERIHSLISRAADTAKRGNLINRSSRNAAETSQESSAPPPNPTAKAVNHNPTEQIAKRASQLPANQNAADVRELSLSELSARAAKLQQQFREERQRLADEGKLPNPAEYPKAQPKSAPKLSPEPKAPEAPAPKAAETPAKAETVVKEPAVEEKAVVKPATPQADTEAINKIAPKISYQGIQTSAFNFGTLGSVPGQTLAINAMAVADSAQVQDLSGTYTKEQVLAQQQKLTAIVTPEPAPVPPAESKAAEAAVVKAEPVLTSEEINALKELARHAQELQRAEYAPKSTQSPAPAQVSEPEVLSSEPKAAQTTASAQTVAAQQEPAVEEPVAVVIPESTAEETPNQEELPAAAIEEPEAPAAVVIPEQPEVTEEAAPVVVVPPEVEAAPITAERSAPTVTANEKAVTAQPQVITPEEQAYAESAAQAAKRQEAAAEPDAQTEPEAEVLTLPAEEAEEMASVPAEEPEAVPEETNYPEEESLNVPPMPSPGSPSRIEPAFMLEQQTVAPMPNLSQSSPTATPEEEAANDLAKLYSKVNTSKMSEPAPAEPQAAPEIKAETTASIMLSTVPADELEDSEIPQDAKLQGADGKAGMLATAALDTTQELNPELKTQPLSAPGAAAVTTGGSDPIPEQSVVEAQHTIKENTLFSRIVSLFGSKSKGENLTAQATQATMAAAGSGNALSSIKGNPLDSMLYALRSQAENPNMPDQLRAQAQKLIQQLQEPVADLVSVNNWLNFVTGPISPSSPQALALHQWAFMLLCIRFNHIGKAIDKYLAKVKGEGLKESFTKTANALSNQGGEVLDLLEETLDEVTRLQKLNENREPDQVFPRYIPLPPNYSEGREGGLAIRSEQEEDGKKSWHLTFNFDLPGLGPIEIKAVAKLPELRLSVVAETLSGLQRVQECMPLLTKELQKAGITTRAANARLGRIMLQTDPVPEQHQAERADGSSLSVEI